MTSLPKSLSGKVCSHGGHICNASGQLKQHQVQSKLMGESWNLKNFSLNSRLNYIFQISNKIWKKNELSHECCFLCSNNVKKSLFFRQDQPMRMRSFNALMTAHAQLLVQPQVSMGTGASNGRCSDAMTLPINDWLFHLEGGTIPPYCALQFFPFISIGVNRLCISIVFVITHWLDYAIKQLIMCC